MAGEGEAKIRIRLDTSSAQSSLGELTNKAKASAGRIADSIKGSISGGLRTMSYGAAFGAGMHALEGATSSGIGDVIGESFGGLGARIEASLLGDMAPEARASKYAREQTIAAFGIQAGQQGAIPAGAKSFYDSIMSIRTEQENGRQVFETSPDFRKGDIGDIIDRIVSGIGAELGKAVEALANKLNPFNW